MFFSISVAIGALPTLYGGAGEWNWALNHQCQTPTHEAQGLFMKNGAFSDTCCTGRTLQQYPAISNMSTRWQQLGVRVPAALPLSSRLLQLIMQFLSSGMTQAGEGPNRFLLLASCDLIYTVGNLQKCVILHNNNNNREMLAPHYIWAANLYLLNLSQYLKCFFFFMWAKALNINDWIPTF